MRCPDKDPETGECIRRWTRCSCNPPRCGVCGRFVRDWGDTHPACDVIVDEAEKAELRQQVEEQGLVP